MLVEHPSVPINRLDDLPLQVLFPFPFPYPFPFLALVVHRDEVPSRIKRGDRVLRAVHQDGHSNGIGGRENERDLQRGTPFMTLLDCDFSIIKSRNFKIFYE